MSEPDLLDLAGHRVWLDTLQSNGTCEIEGVMERHETRLLNAMLHRRGIEEAPFDSPFVLLVGQEALNSYRPDLDMLRVHGRVMVLGDSKVGMGIHGMDVAMNNRSAKESIGEDLELWLGIIRGELDPLMYGGLECCQCSNWLVELDRMNLGYCKAHYSLYKWRTTRWLT